MAKLNIFKIKENQKEKFLNSIGEAEKVKEIMYKNKTNKVCFKSNLNKGDATLSWKWLLDELDLEVNNITKFPEAMIYVEYNNNLYVATFGTAYNLVDKYSDKNFALGFAKRFKYEKIKSTAQANPNSNKNKVINSYLDNEYFEYESGSAIIKIKGRLKLEDDFDLFAKNIEIGTSLKLTIENPSLQKLVEIIDYIDNTVSEKDEITSIPLFYVIDDEDEQNELDESLKSKIINEEVTVSMSDFDIIGTTEVFYAQGVKYQIWHKNKHENCDILNIEEIKKFCKNKKLDFSDVVLDIQIKILNEDGHGVKCPFKNILDCTLDEKNAVLIKGEWFKYNLDYLVYLEESLKDLPCYHYKMFDWNQSLHDEFISNQLPILAQDPKHNGKSNEELKAIAQRIYYPERVYNKLMEEQNGYICGDRSLVRIDNQQRLEVDDFHKDNKLYVVKIGNTSGKLCYVIDQIDLAMRCIKNKTIQPGYIVKKLSIVLIVNKKKEFPIEDGTFSISTLKLLALKNSLNNWQKEARKLAFEPEVIIAYK